MRRAALLLVVLALCLACVHARPDADPYLLRAEQSLAVGVDVLDAWFLLERQHEVLIEAKLPGAHAETERLRRDAPAYIRTVTAAMDAYRVAPGPEGKASIQKALAVFLVLVERSQGYLAAYERGGI